MLLFNSERANPNELMVVMMITPVAVLTVPVAVMLMMPIFIVPVVISMIFVGQRCQRSTNYRPEYNKSKK